MRNPAESIRDRYAPNPRIVAQAAADPRTAAYVAQEIERDLERLRGAADNAEMKLRHLRDLLAAEPAAPAGDGPAYLTMDEAAKRLRFSRNWVHDRIADGTLKARRFGAQWRIDAADFERYVADRAAGRER